MQQPAMNLPRREPASAAGSENFVSKLYQMLDTPQFSGIVAWNQTPEGPSFVIFDTAQFQEFVLVNEFKHANFSSFVRQLNKYDFHKVKFRDQQSRIWEFMHPHFRPENRDKPWLIRRKPQSSGRRVKRNETAITEETAEAVRAAETAAKDAENLVQGQFTDLETRVRRLEKNNLQILNALKLQQSLVERLLAAAKLPDEDDAPPGPDMDVDARHASASPSAAVASPGGVVSSPAPLRMPMSPNPSALVAIDDATTRELMIKFLLEFGFRLEPVPDGSAVVQHAEVTLYDYIIVGSVLKALDGVSATEIVRQTHNKQTPVLMLAEASDRPHVEMFLSRGVNAVLFRPFSKSELFQALEQFRL